MRCRVPSHVAVRKEAFGALLYDYRSRRLTFVKDPAVASVIESMDGSTVVAELVDASQQNAEQRARVLAALKQLHDRGMLECYD